jgi:hypothetical protein
MGRGALKKATADASTSVGMTSFARHDEVALVVVGLGVKPAHRDAMNGGTNLFGFDLPGFG